MNRIFKKLLDQYPTELFVYINDILVATGDDLERHRKIVHAVLDLLEEESYFLKLSKCEFEKPTVSYLGVVVSKNQITIDPDCHGSYYVKQSVHVTWSSYLL